MTPDPDLNPAQHEAVHHPGGPLLILAGAGSGKTRVITYRIAELLRRGVEPRRILAVTFTNKAAAEMRARAERRVGKAIAGLWIGTFHAICARLLRAYAERVKLKRGFVIFDEADQRSLMVRVLGELGMTDRFASPRAILGEIDQAKNCGLGPDEYQGKDYFTDRVARVYPVYQERLERAGGVDFGDLLLKAVWLCERDPEIGPRMAGRFEHVLVDEFQDTNRVQYRLVSHLASRHGNLCVVGDDDQSIYRWRGAEVRNILDFEHDHPGTHVVRLEQNYRSTQIILDAANAVIARNFQRKSKRLFTDRLGGDPILYFTAEDERREAEFVVRVIRKLSDDEGRAPDEFAVFYRTHAQSRAIEEAMRTADMPYTVVGGIRFYDRAEVKDLLAYLRVIANPADDVSLERILNRPPRGIGEATFKRVLERARADGVTAFEALRKLSQEGGEAGSEALGAGPRRRLASFVELVDELRRFGGPLSALAEQVLDRTGYRDRLAADGTPESQERIANLMELVGSIKAFELAEATATSEAATQEGEPTSLLNTYLERVSLVAPADANTRGVALMTVHAAKGLEFPVVFVTGLEDGVFPSLRNGEDLENLEEERRLAYVALTRARERLFLTNARTRHLFGRESCLAESRFLRDIPAEVMARPAPLSRPARARLWRRRQQREGMVIEYDQAPAPGEAEETAFYLGQRVRHPQFGEGEVRGVSGTGAGLKLTVYFPAAGGPKTIVARFVEAL